MPHTPGPWTISDEVDPSDGEREVYVQRDRQDTHVPQYVARVCCWGSYDEEAQANARLIAAAPALLEALRPLMAQVQAEVNYYRNQYPDAEGADHPVVQDGTQALNAAHAAIRAATEGR